MKKVIAASAVAFALATTVTATEIQVGLGYTISDGLNSSALNQPANIRVPINFDFGLRVEPELGFGASTTDFGGVKTDRSQTTLAVGGYYNLWAVEKVNFYAGGRMALNSFSVDTTVGGVTTTFDGTNTSLQGLFGAEYMFAENFSFGAQAGLEFIAGDDPTGFGTVSHLLVHYFF